MRTEPYDDRLTKGAFVARKKKRQMLLLLFAYKKQVIAKKVYSQKARKLGVFDRLWQKNQKNIKKIEKSTCILKKDVIY